MATTVRTVLTVQAFQSTLNFGPWPFESFNSYAEFFGADLVIGATSRAQIIGGTAPVVSYITTVQSLLLWTPTTDVEAGAEIPVKVYLRPYRGERIERSLTVKIPAGMPKGEHRLLFSDADTLDRSQDGAAKNNKNMDIPSTVSLLNQERDNNRLYVSLVQSRATFYSDDKTLPNLPSSVVNVMQTERNSSRSLVGTPDSTEVQQSIPFDQVVSGAYSLRIKVK